MSDAGTLSTKVGIENYNVVEGSTVTVITGTDGVNITELAGTAATSTVLVGGRTLTGNYAGFDAADVLEVTSNANVSGANSGTALGLGVVDFNDTDAVTLTMSVAQHNDMSVTDTTNTQTLTMSDAGTLVGKGGIENYVLAGIGGTTFTQVAGNINVTSGRANDTIITSGDDAVRGQLTVDLTAGGVNTVLLRNDAWNGEGLVDPVANQNKSIEGPDNEWTSVPNSNQFGVEILGFVGGANGDKLDIYYNTSSSTISRVEENYVLGTANELNLLSSGGVIELSSAHHTLGETWTVKEVAEMLSGRGEGDMLVGLKDGNYTVVIYSDKESSSADAHLFNIRVDGGDGLDFTISASGINSQADTDMIEYVGTLREVGSDTLTASNFI